MSKFKRIAGLVAGAILATGVFAGAAAPAEASSHADSARMALLDTGWGG